MSPTHDYILSNQSGASFRTDLNNALAAIVSNNSSSSQPATRYAYQWWADTSSGILKLRNSANDAWIELLQLDGTLTLEDGSASTPALAFRDDLNTGIFSSEADSFNVATGGVERMKLGDVTVFNESGADVDFRIEGDTNANLFKVDAGNDRIGIGIASPFAKLTVFGSGGQEARVVIEGEGGADPYLNFLANNATHFSIGIDDSDSDKFKISKHSALGTNDYFVIDVNSNVAIGTTDPDGDKLLIQLSNENTNDFRVKGGATQLRTNVLLQASNADASGFTAYRLVNSAGSTVNSISMQNSDSSVSYTTGIAGGDMVFKTITSGTTNQQTRMTIAGAGNVNINNLCTAGAGFAQFDNAQSLISQSSVGSATQQYFIGNAAIQVSSDRRIKENIVDTSLNAITELNKVRVVDFSWNDPQDKAINNKNARGKWTGCIAQEIVDIFPHSVNAPRPEGKEIDYDSEHLWTMEYEHLVPVLIKAVQELSAKVAALESL